MHSKSRLELCFHRSRARACGLAAGLLFAAAPNGLAVNFDWNGSVDNDWLNGANWTSPVGGPPQGGDGNFARFYPGAPRAATISADIPVVQDILSANDGTAGVRQIDQTAGTVNLNGWMRLGQDPDGAGPLTGTGDGGTYNMSGGTINAGSYRIGEAAGATATVTLSGNAVFNQRDVTPSDQGAWTRIGEFGTGNFNLSGNATASFDSRVMIGAAGGSNALVTQTGGTFEVRRGELVISDTGGTDAQPVTYNISAGVLRTLAAGPDDDQGGNITIGQWDNSRGLLKASGTATVRAARDIQIAVGENIGNPTGTLMISDDATVTFARRFTSGRQIDGGNMGGNNGGVINLSLSGNGLFRQDDVADLDAETNWNFFAENATSVATVTVTGGTMSFDARTFFARNGNATFNQNGGIVEVRRGELDIAENGTGTYNLSGGTLRVLNGSPLVVGRWQNGVGQVNVSGTGQLSASGDLIVGNGDDITQNPLATGTVTQTGGRATVGGNLLLANATQASGTYNLQGGVLDLTSGSITKGAGAAIFKFTGGTLLDARTINVPVNQEGGILAPGALNSAGRTTINGNYSLQSAGTIELSIISPALSDLVDVNGTVSLNGGRLMVTGDTPGLPIGLQFIVLANDGTDPITGTFLGLPEGQDFTSAGGNIFDISYVGGDGNDVRLLVVVPEPTTPLVLLGGSGALVLLRRRRS